jgi:hypothetical protein
MGLPEKWGVGTFVWEKLCMGGPKIRQEDVDAVDRHTCFLLLLAGEEENTMRLEYHRVHRCRIHATRPTRGSFLPSSFLLFPSIYLPSSFPCGVFLISFLLPFSLSLSRSLALSLFLSSPHLDRSRGYEMVAEQIHFP